MQEIVNKLVDALGSFLPDVNVSIKLGIIGAVIMLVIFFIALIASSKSKIDGYRKILISTTKWLGGVNYVDESNVEQLLNELNKHPEETQTGWSRFMDQRIGYPSDYMPAQDVLNKKDYSGKHTAGKVLMIVLGIIVVALIGVIGYMTDIEATDIMSAIIAIEFVIIPVAAYVIFILLIDIVYNRKARRLELAYNSFCEILDEKVAVSDKEEREFFSENLDEINKRVDELLASGVGEDEVVEVVSVPEEEVVEEVPEVEEVAEEVVAVEEPVQFIDYGAMTEEEKENFFNVLLDIVDRAIADEELGDEGLYEIAEVLYSARISDAYSEEDQAILDECLYKLAGKASE